MTTPLLPPSSTPLERAAARALAEIARVPVPIRDLWNIRTCPVPLLPYLAWAVSVDRWDDAWPEATKREVIRKSFWLHKRKGTITSLRRAVEPLGYLIEVIEWWQQAPATRRGTFRLRVGVLDTGITDEMFNELARIIEDVKPATRHLVGLEVSLEARGHQFFGAATTHGQILTVYPYTPESVPVSGPAYVGAATHLISILTVYP
ncbi:phage tail protein I [Pandoraea nosoerga]|uniref:phage tail protein I n=1 Tax=Pandoraea nosoerga TaxID=2508296 RepID=UPI00197E2DA9|nr:phage tail protein I [Pandoraea nosoerga]MBN4667203.1 phage tail protein I [Pandoraea nosoerga]MBN4677190.1 phage tail protein I [Pandoraea nosoerga]MBN4681988.1 phage tail protein I [Pandoraea nosoerga]MBN4746306.1 phage tail protein I [Pandoraea nosoerga]